MNKDMRLTKCRLLPVGSSKLALACAGTLTYSLGRTIHPRDWRPHPRLLCQHASTSTQMAEQRPLKGPTEPLAMKYAYDQLPIVPQIIRLLHLKPASTNTEELRASLVHADISQEPPPEYEALSYVWGDPVLPQVLHLDGGRTHAITTNLFNCLVSLRKVDMTRVLWVDAVCINQENLQEKEQQIALMGKIYKNATRAVIWLGQPPSTPESPTSFLSSLEDDARFSGDAGDFRITYRNGKMFLLWPVGIVSTLSEEWPLAVGIHAVEAPPDAESFSFTLESGEEIWVDVGKRPSSPLPPNTVPLDGFTLVRRRASELLVTETHDLQLGLAILRESAIFRVVKSFFSNDEFERVLRYGIEEVYTNPWFTRMWIVQEVCLAPKAVLIHRGCEMDWLDFSMAMTLLGATIKDERRDIPAPAAFDRACELVRVANLFKAATTSTQSGEQRLLFISRLSHTLRSQKCKFDHDRIYALLSLWPEESPLTSIVPDYSKPCYRFFASLPPSCSLSGC